MTQHHYKLSAKQKPRNHEDDDGDDEKQGMPVFQMTKKPYREYLQTFSAQHVHYYLSESIGAPSEYTDMIYRISMSGPSDTIYIHLNTHGGQLETGVQLINAMQNSAAKIVTIIEGSAYSLGTLIFLAGDEMIVNDNCMMMFHNFNGGLIGKGNELVSELEATIKWFSALARDIYIPFISEEEFTQITKGEDMWIQSPEIRTRLDNMVALLNASAEAAAQEEEEEIAAIEAAILAQQAAKKVAKDANPVAPKVKKPVGRRKKEVVVDN